MRLRGGIHVEINVLNIKMLNMEILNYLNKLNETETPAGGGISLKLNW